MHLVVGKEQIDIEFNNLDEETQISLYQKDKIQFTESASKSQYYTVRSLVAKDEETDPAILLEMAKNEKDFIVFKKIINNKKFEKTDEIIKELFASEDFEIRKVIVCDTNNSSELLNWMLIDEMEKHPNLRLALNAVSTVIVNNPKFVESEETKEFLSAKGFYIYGSEGNKWIRKITNN